MPELNLGTVNLTNDSLTAGIFRRCINPRKGKTRKKVTVYLDVDLLGEYEKHHPRQDNGSFGTLSDDVNKSLAVWMQVNNLI
ncbi:hypothetical protein F1737_04375 [Methanoplanus sp. FWC-SCC4]|uniref:Uncharacterized protein n=1 Tax=Methanochimaera problematica TaxID=2609417 RepID=A0AA97I462_9EURY|nr:hypothetical protein [Methanoplanus sp. FWC-SCC4]WOF15991.1 hypothetical protein F1737_04375 [Methanoplanus sp. FWC-SCC4]